ncbi:CDP-glycerol glycerophosphotransferase family protein [bacterium]|nr:CDP-glycerol glycerophosphotransferase family protein [bacterium]
MKTIFITISRGSLIRNFFHTGVISRLLNAGFRVVVLTPQYDKPEIFTEYAHPNLILEPLIDPKDIRFRGIIRELQRGASFNKTINLRYRYPFAGDEPSKILYPLRLLFLAPLRFFPGFKRLLRFIEYKANPQHEHDYLFEKYKPDLVFTTAVYEPSDDGVLKSAKRFGVPTVCMPKSWDNPSKLLFPVMADKIIVWSPFMKEQVMKLQGYREKEIFISGAPQFDIYTSRDPHILLSREEFSRRLGLDPKKKIILYGSTGMSCLTEADYCLLIKKYIDAGELGGAQILVRPHIGYAGDLEKFAPLKKLEPDIVIDTSDTQDNTFKDRWDPSRAHLYHLYNSLYHSDACINMGSTLTIDAILCGTPVINVAFDIVPMPMSRSPRRFYKSDYIEAVARFGVTRLVRNEDEYKKALKDLLLHEKPEADSHRDFVEYFAYRNDGRSAERVAGILKGVSVL